MLHLGLRAVGCCEFRVRTYVWLYKKPKGRKLLVSRLRETVMSSADSGELANLVTISLNPNVP